METKKRISILLEGYLKSIVVEAKTYEELKTIMDKKTLGILDREIKKTDQAINNKKIKVTDGQMSKLDYFFPIDNLRDFKGWLRTYSRFTKNNKLLDVSLIIGGGGVR